jgi:pyruvate,orthophosphate dikinase
VENDMPIVFDQLVKICQTLEHHFRDIQDFKFTIENDKLSMLQTRDRKRTGLAVVRIAVEMVNEGLIDKAMAIECIPADSVSSRLVLFFDTPDKKKVQKITSRLPAGPGAASENAYFSAKKAEEMHSKR